METLRSWQEYIYYLYFVAWPLVRLRLGNSRLWADIVPGSFCGGAASSKKNFTSPTLIFATSLILLGCGLLSTLGGGREFYTPAYGYQLILGLGVGLTFSSGTLLTNLACKSGDVGKLFYVYYLQRP